MDDLELLWEYGRTGSSDAFATVAKRYIDLVYTSALRQVGGDPHLAEDVTQAVLLILMHKGGSLPRGTIVPGWLVRVTRFAARDAMKLAIRRRRHEAQAAMERPTESVTTEAKWNDLAPIIDEALTHLSTPDRDAVVLRYFLNKTPAEAAWIMGVTEDALRQRVSRAIKRLRSYFADKGIATSAEASFGAMIASHAIIRAPEAIASLAATICGPAAGTAMATPPSVIAREALRGIRWADSRMLVGLASAGIAVICIVGLALAYHHLKSQANPVIGGSTATPADFPRRQAGPAVAPRPRQYANICLAANANDLGAVRQMLDSGVSANFRSTDGQDMPPLLFAAFHGNDSAYDLCKLLLDRGADVNGRRGERSYSALFLAVRHNSPRTVQLLLDRGADPTIIMMNGNTALDWAKQDNKQAMIDLLTRVSATTGPARPK
ncbi:MAG TPA: sigma-70 family RNA polymerase sigma factor [Tepidisphaeraceae bacterium]|jgi:RNA polymerase sigma factor (sigma-70 family)